MGLHIGTAKAAAVVGVKGLTFATLSRNAAAVRLTLSRPILPMRATSLGSKPLVATGDSVLPSFDAIQTIKPVAFRIVQTRPSAPSSAPGSASADRSLQISDTSSQRIDLDAGDYGYLGFGRLRRFGNDRDRLLQRFLQFVAPLARILYGALWFRRQEQQGDRDPDGNRAAGEHDLLLADRGRAAIVRANQSVPNRLDLGRRGREQVADLGEDHVSGQLHLAAAGVAARAPLGGSKLVDPVEGFGQRAAGRLHHPVEVDDTLAEAIDRFLGALAPERQALAGGDIGMQRGSNVEKQLGCPAHRGLRGGGSDPLTAQRVFVLEGAICDAGGSQQTKHEAGDADGPAEHRRTV